MANGKRSYWSVVFDLSDRCDVYILFHTVEARRRNVKEHTGIACEKVNSCELRKSSMCLMVRHVDDNAVDQELSSCST